MSFSTLQSNTTNNRFNKKIFILSAFGVILTFAIFIQGFWDGDDLPANLYTPTPIVWTGKIHWYMTYGRRLFENLIPGSEYKYFIAEPEDVIYEGGLRYSPTTMNIKDSDIVKVTGTMTDNCYWDSGVDDTDYDGCVPWIRIEEIEIIE